MFVAPEHGEDRNQARLLRPASLVLFVMVVLAVVLGVAWQYGWRGRLAFSESAADAGAQLAGARLMLRSGQFQAAEQQLRPVLRDSRNPLYRDGRLLQWRIAKMRALALPTASPARGQALRDLRPMLASLYALGSWPAPQWRSFAQDALAIGAYALSAQGWMAAAEADPEPELALQDREAAARAWVAGGNSAEGGRLLLELAAQSRQGEQEKSLFLQGMRWVEGGAGAKVALAQGLATLGRLPSLWQDHEVVLWMARLALAAGHPRLAAQWLHRELLHQPAEKP